MSLEIKPTEIVIVVPIYRNYILEEEKFAIRHMRKYLSDYRIIVVSPEGLILPNVIDDLPVEFFASHYFADIQGYNALMLSSKFYERFGSYRYMLVHQLDALVFSDKLLEFCQMGWDYIGAPWFANDKDPTRGFLRSGNGGLSLRKIDSFLSVLSSPSLHTRDGIRNFVKAMITPFNLWEQNNILRFFKRANIAQKARHGVGHYLNNYQWNEDRFWAFQASLFYSSFTVAPVNIGLKFAFEQFPEYCFLRNNEMLPFGCHGWYRYNQNFWEHYLEYE